MSFSYCLFMIYMSLKNDSIIETVFYILLILVQMALMLPDTLPGAWLLRPFLKRPETEIEDERFEIVRRYEVPKSAYDFSNDE